MHAFTEKFYFICRFISLIESFKLRVIPCFALVKYGERNTRAGARKFPPAQRFRSDSWYRCGQH